MAVNVPAELGGAGAGAVAYALAMQEIARACASTAVTMSVTNMVGEAIARFGTDAQKSRHCPRLASGDHVARAASRSASPTRERSGRACARRRGATAATGCSTAASSGSRAAAHAGVFIVWARTAPPGDGTRGHLVLPRRGGRAGPASRAPGGQDGHPRLEHRAARVRRIAASRRARCSARRTAASRSP